MRFDYGFIERSGRPVEYVVVRGSYRDPQEVVFRSRLSSADGHTSPAAREVVAIADALNEGGARGERTLREVGR